MSRRWIITGANGYLGGELCRILHDRGESVVGLARAGRSLEHLTGAGIPCQSYDEIPSVLSDGDIFVHCAGRTGNRGGWDEFVKVNRDWSVSLFEQVSSRGARCYIYVSSVAAMGYRPRSVGAPLDESSPPKHAEGDLYGRSKLAAEEALLQRAESNQARLVILRPGLIYGRKTLSSSGPEVVDQEQRVPLVHIYNFTDALVGIVDHEVERDTFLVVDGEQPTLGHLNSLKTKLGIFNEPPRRIGKVGFWMKWMARSVFRIMTGRAREASLKLALAEYSFQTRRLFYSTEKLRSLTGWTPKVGLQSGLQESMEAAGPARVKLQKRRAITPAVLVRAAYNRLTLKADRGSTGIGLIGIGGYGSTNAANIMRTGRFSIVGVHDPSGRAAERFTSRYGTKRYEGLEELLKDPDILAIAATVPNQFHEEIVMSAADAGKHIFMEKPLARYADVCRELGRYCREKGVILQVGHQMRREPVFREIKRVVESGFLGRPLNANAVYTLDRRFRDDWRRDAGSCPGGSMEQLGAHLIDVLIYLFGPPSGTESWAENIPRVSDGLEWGCVLMSFENDIQAAVSTSFSSPDLLRFEVVFDGGKLSTDGRTLRIGRDGSGPRRMKPRGRAGGVDQFIEFADCIEGGKKPETGADQAAAVMDVVGSISCPAGEQDLD